MSKGYGASSRFVSWAPEEGCGVICDFIAVDGEFTYIYIYIQIPVDVIITTIYEVT